MDLSVLVHESLVGARGPGGRLRAAPENGYAGRSRYSLLGLQRHLHGHRLDSVARSALVFHHVRPADHRRTGPDGDGVPDYPDGPALQPAAGFAVPDTPAPP